MADGGYRPAYNVPFATGTQSGLIAAVAVDNVGSHMGKLRPMREQMGRDYGIRPAEHLLDGGFAKLDDPDRPWTRYRKRAASAECTNARARNRGLVAFTVRGIDKVGAVVLRHAMACNMACLWRSRPASRSAPTTPAQPHAAAPRKPCHAASASPQQLHNSASCHARAPLAAPFHTIRPNRPAPNSSAASQSSRPSTSRMS